MSEFPVDLPAALGFTQVDEFGADPFVGHAVAFTRDKRYALVIVGGDPGRRTPDEARDVAGQIVARLGLSPPAPGATPGVPS